MPAFIRGRSCKKGKVGSIYFLLMQSQLWDYYCRSIWLCKISKRRKKKQRSMWGDFRYTVQKEFWNLQTTAWLFTNKYLPKAEHTREHLDSFSIAPLPSCPEIQYINEVKDVWQAQLCCWDTALAYHLLACATPGMLGLSTLKLTSGWTGGILALAEKRLQSWFSHLNFWFRSKSQKMQPTLSNSQDVYAARQFLAHWTTTSYFLDQEDILETNLLWSSPRWQITGPVRFLPLL